MTLTPFFDVGMIKRCHCKRFNPQRKVFIIFLKEFFGGTHGYLGFFMGLLGQKLSFFPFQII
jgi:hypothetical protein